jgi:hypothetical protein
VRFLIGLVPVLGMAMAWDVARGRRPGFLEQSLLSYSVLAPQLDHLWQRLAGYLDLLRYASGSPLLNWVLVAGLPLLMAVAVLHLKLTPASAPAASCSIDVQPAGNGRQAAWADLVLVGFGALFMIGHALFAFQVWDRYLLGLIPLSALLLARILTLPWRFGHLAARGAAHRTHDANPQPGRAAVRRGAHCGGVVGLMVLVLATTAGPLQDAAASRLPVGGDHGAYDGIEQVVDYFRAVPADTTFYQRWLGAHWRFYLWGSPYDFRAWTSPDDLAAQAAARPGARRFTVFPSWHSATEARLHLEDHGLTMREAYRTLRRDGSVSFIVYRIEEIQ